MNYKCKNFLIANGYRPRDGNVTDFLTYVENSFNEIDFTKLDVFLMGDFNIDYLDKKSDNTKRLKRLLKQFGMDQFINKPTRYSELKYSCLDLICSNSDYIANHKVCDINISDHELVMITRKKISIKSEKVTFTGRYYKNYDKELFSENLQNQDSAIFNENNNTEDLWSVMIDNITNCIDNMCPLKQFKVRNSDKPWFTNEILEQIKDKDRAFRKAKRSGKSDD